MIFDVTECSAALHIALAQDEQSKFTNQRNKFYFSTTPPNPNMAVDLTKELSKHKGCQTRLDIWVCSRKCQAANSCSPMGCLTGGWCGMWHLSTNDSAARCENWGLDQWEVRQVWRQANHIMGGWGPPLAGRRKYDQNIKFTCTPT